MRTIQQLIACIAVVAAKPNVFPMPPLFNEIQELLGVTVTPPKPVGTSRIPYLNWLNPKPVEPQAQDTELEGQQAAAEPPYRVTASGQYATPQDFAAALTREGGVPPAMAQAIAESTATLNSNMVSTARAMASLLDVLYDASPRPRALAQPVLRGVEAAGRSIPQPVVTALTDLFVQMGELAANTVDAVSEAPALAFLTLPSEELSNGATNTLAALSPLDPQTFMEGYQAPKQDVQGAEYEAEYEDEAGEE